MWVVRTPGVCGQWELAVEQLEVRQWRVLAAVSHSLESHSLVGEWVQQQPVVCPLVPVGPPGWALAEGRELALHVVKES